MQHVQSCGSRSVPFPGSLTLTLCIAVMGACLSCLGSLVNNVSKNYRLVRDCFRRYFSIIVAFKKLHQKDPRYGTVPTLVTGVAEPDP